MFKRTVLIPGNILKYIVNYLLLIIGRIRSLNYDSSNSIFINGSPRSGTTWLGEIFGQIPETSIIWESFHIRDHEDLKKIGFDWRTHIESESPDQLKMNVIEDIISGRRLDLYTCKYVSPFKIFKIKRWIIKSVRAHWFLSAITRHCSINTPIHIIRHPCATVSSQMHRRRSHNTSE